MEVIEDIGQYNWEGGACVTVGTFDGLHIGHRKIIKELVQNARSCGLRSVVITFDPHPRQVLAKGSAAFPAIINSIYVLAASAEEVP